MNPDQGYRPGQGRTRQSSRMFKTITVVVLVAVAAITGAAIIYHSLTNHLTNQADTPPKESTTIWSSGLFQMYPGEGKGSNGTWPTLTSVGQSFVVLNNMTDVHVYGAFTSNESISLMIEDVSPYENSSQFSLPVGAKEVWSSGITEGRSIFVSLPTIPSSQIGEIYIITFTMEKPIITEVNVTSTIILAYNYS